MLVKQEKTEIDHNLVNLDKILHLILQVNQANLHILKEPHLE